MTQVHLELCGLRGWAVAGLSIDYGKCFDFLPKAVVVALALELGIDLGTCRGWREARSSGRTPVTWRSTRLAWHQGARGRCGRVQ